MLQTTNNIQRSFRARKNMYWMIRIPFAFFWFYKKSRIMKSVFVFLCLTFQTHGLLFCKRKICQRGAARASIPLSSNYTWHLSTFWWRNPVCYSFKETHTLLQTAVQVLLSLWPHFSIIEQNFLPSKYGYRRCRHQTVWLYCRDCKQVITLKLIDYVLRTNRQGTHRN
jgi:hypothetical protein